MEQGNNMFDLMNYSTQNSNSNNYSSTDTSSSPTSFTNLMENGILVDYKTIEYASEVIEKSIDSELEKE